MTALGLGLGFGILDLLGGIWTTVKLGFGLNLGWELGFGTPLPPSQPSIVGSLNDGSQSICSLDFQILNSGRIETKIPSNEIFIN